jgi:hypothetical protein
MKKTFPPKPFPNSSRLHSGWLILAGLGLLLLLTSAACKLQGNASPSKGTAAEVLQF